MKLHLVLIALISILSMSCATNSESRGFNTAGNQDIVEEQRRDVNQRFRYMDFRGARF